MRLFKKADDLHKWLESQRKSGNTIGFVPTMGALHKGHISLLKASLNANKLTVCSIFVNPTQFNDPEDFKKYPITIDKDILLLEEAGCDALFFPAKEEIYPDGISVIKRYDLGDLESVFEGKYRPGHFQGVCMVVHRLLEIVRPDNIYLGQKDYQQCKIITKLIELIGLHKLVKINICPTLREPDGLAMSSRNMRLSENERKRANSIYSCLTMIKERIEPGNEDILITEALTLLENIGFNPDYIAIADATNLSSINNWDGKQKIIILAAAYLNEIRLIDNMIIN